MFDENSVAMFQTLFCAWKKGGYMACSGKKKKK